MMILIWLHIGSFVQVTLVMAYLNGNDIPDFFRHRTLFTKVCILFLHMMMLHRAKQHSMFPCCFCVRYFMYAPKNWQGSFICDVAFTDIGYYLHSFIWIAGAPQQNLASLIPALQSACFTNHQSSSLWLFHVQVIPFMPFQITRFWRWICNWRRA